MILGEKCIRLHKYVGYHGVKAVFCLRCFLARTLNLVALHVQETGRHTHLRRIFFPSSCNWNHYHCFHI